MSITPKQKRLLDFISQFVFENGYAPSQQEMAKAFGYKSLGTIQDFLIRLQEQGHLQKPWNAKRGIKIRPQEFSLPLLGKVAAGNPIEHMIHQEFIDVPRLMIKKSGEHYVLQVKGDSMREEGILEKDYVVVRKQNTAENGQKVIALLDLGATIKTYFKRKEIIELKPSNSKYQSIFVDSSTDFKIEGIMVGLVRYS